MDGWITSIIGSNGSDGCDGIRGDGSWIMRRNGSVLDPIIILDGSEIDPIAGEMDQNQQQYDPDQSKMECRGSIMIHHAGWIGINM